MAWEPVPYPGLQQTAFRQRDFRTPTDNQVVEYSNVDFQQQFLQIAGQLDVTRGRLRDPGGVIVGENHFLCLQLSKEVYESTLSPIL